MCSLCIYTSCIIPQRVMIYPYTHIIQTMTIMVIYITKRVHYTVIPNTKPSSQTTTASPHTYRTDRNPNVNPFNCTYTERKKKQHLLTIC